MANLKILVPYNYTKNDEKTLDFITQRYGQTDDVIITLMHLYVPVPNVEVSDKTVMARLIENMAYLRQKIRDAEEAIVAAKKTLISAGFQEAYVHTVFKKQGKDVAQEIIDMVRQEQFSTVILNRQPSRITRFFTPSISKKVSRLLSDIDIITVV